MKILTFLVFFCIFLESKSKLSGFESNIEKIESSSSVVFERLDKILEILKPYVERVDEIEDNYSLFNQDFLKDINEFIS